MNRLAALAGHQVGEVGLVPEELGAHAFDLGGHTRLRVFDCRRHITTGACVMETGRVNFGSRRFYLGTMGLLGVHEMPG